MRRESTVEVHLLDVPPNIGRNRLESEYAHLTHYGHLSHSGNRSFSEVKIVDRVQQEANEKQ